MGACIIQSGGSAYTSDLGSTNRARNEAHTGRVEVRVTTREAMT